MRDRVRFWVHVNGGPVKLTLRKGDVLNWARGYSHEEGWSSEHVQWLYPTWGPGRIHRHWCTDGVDCDGRMSTHDFSICHVEDLHGWHTARCSVCHNTLTGATIDEMLSKECLCCGARQPLEGYEVYPRWDSVNTRQRDYSAEAMGY
jgi:hypothetical protein